MIALYFILYNFIFLPSIILKLFKNEKPNIEIHNFVTNYLKTKKM